MCGQELSGPYMEAIERGFAFARELGHVCGPVHLLIGISEGEGPAALVLGSNRSLREVVASTGHAFGDAAGYVQAQAQGAARLFADGLGHSVGVEHLLVALLDQGTPDVALALRLAGLDPAVIRRSALAAIGAPAEQPLIELPPLTPAGTLDRPPIPIEHLDTRAWNVLRWRQEHLPLERLRGPSDRQALRHLEVRAAWRIADALGLEDDQRYSLSRHHADEVDRRIAAPPRVTPRPLRRRGFLHAPVGWEAWLRNRQVSLRDRWFELRMIGYSRAAPPPGTADDGSP